MKKKDLFLSSVLMLQLIYELELRIYREMKTQQKF